MNRELLYRMTRYKKLKEYRQIFNAAIDAVFFLEDSIEKLDRRILISNDAQLFEERVRKQIILAETKARARAYDRLVYACFFHFKPFDNDQE